MHLYLFDSRLQNRKYKRLLNQLDLQLSSLGIAGEIIYLKKFEDPKNLLAKIIREKPLNIIIAGDDDTFLRISHLLLKDESIRKNSVIGFMPLLGSQYLAKILGLPPKLEAARVVSRRITRKINLSKANSYLFFSKLEIEAKKKIIGQVLLNGSLWVSSPINRMLISTLDPWTAPSKSETKSKKNLTLAIFPQVSFWKKIKYKKEIENRNYTSLPQASIFRALEEIEIKKPEKISLNLNGKPFINTPCKIQTTNKFFRVIVAGR